MKVIHDICLNITLIHIVWILYYPIDGGADDVLNMYINYRKMNGIVAHSLCAMGPYVVLAVYSTF